MVDGEYRKEIRVDIIDDNLPELQESFGVQLTGVTRGDRKILIIYHEFFSKSLW